MDTGSISIRDKSVEFLAGILRYYEGTPEYKIDRAEQFLDKLMFSTMVETQNPFSNTGRDAYNIAYYARHVLIPQMRKIRMEIDGSDPFNIHRWN